MKWTQWNELVWLTRCTLPSSSELGGQSASVIPYDVSREPVSVHRPLSRFLAGLHLQLHRHGLSYHSREFDRPDAPRPSPEELIGIYFVSLFRGGK